MACDTAKSISAEHCALCAAGEQAGAITAVNDTILTVVSTSFSGNKGLQGGAIGMAPGGTLYVVDSDFTSNEAQNGGAIYIQE